MASLFPDDLADPWSDTASPVPPLHSTASLPGLSGPQPPISSSTTVNINNDDKNDDDGNGNDNTDYLQDLINQNEELLELVAQIKYVTAPSTYTEQYNKHIRNDGLVDFFAVETIFDKSGLNQISIENIINLVTLNQKLDFTTVNHQLWNVILGLIGLEQRKLGAGNFQNLQSNLTHLPDVVLERSDEGANLSSQPAAAVAAATGSIWSDNPTITSLLSPSSVKKSPLGSDSDAKSQKSKLGQNATINLSTSDNDAQLRNTFNPNSNGIISIVEIPEKEGIVFKHINYLVSHNVSLNDMDPPNGRKVIRRYSDFVWLFEVLLKKYPFRMVPGLPPKRFNGSSADSLFLERRKRGLNRFMNIVMKHPILSKEPMVIMFLTIPTELSTWRKQSNIEIIEEFEGQRISKRFIDQWDNNTAQVWADAEKSLVLMQNSWAKISLLVERFERRKQLYNTDNQKFIEILNNLTLTTGQVYSVDPSDIGSINVGLKNIATHIKTSTSLISDESQLIEDGILKEFKEFNEYLTAIYGVFERRKKVGGNNISELKKKVEQNQARLSQLKKKSDVKGSDIDTLVQMINSDKQQIIKQTNRDWLIKECIQQEFAMFQETQYKITKIFQEWVSDRLKYSELHSENWSQLVDSLQDMPSHTF